MFRRQFLAVSALFSVFIGCGKPQPVSTTSPPLPESEVARLIRARIQKHLPNVTAFDPFTILALVGLVARVIQVCQALALLRQQAAVKRRPSGSVAKRIKSRLHDQYAKDHPDSTDAEIAEHIDAALKAFAEATPDELRDVKRRLDAVNNQPTEIDLFNLTEDLSR